MGEGDQMVQGYMYVESANLARFSALEDFALAHPRPARRSDFAAAQTTREKKQQAMKLLPEMMSYMKHNTLSSDQIAEQVARMLADQPKFPSAKDQEKKVKANPFERTFARQFIDASGTKGVGPNTARQVKGNGRGGLIAIWGLEWAYGAHDVSQDTEQLAFNNRKRSLSSNYLGSLENEHICVLKEVDAASVYLLRGAVNSTVAHKGDICDYAEAFNVIIDIPLNSRAPMESVMLYMVAATVDEYSLILPEDQSQSTYEKVCFDYPLMLYSYVKQNTGTFTNMAHTCNERFCSRALFNSQTDPWNIVPAFCPLSTFYPDFFIAEQYGWSPTHTHTITLPPDDDELG